MLALDPREGLKAEPPPEGDFLLLTNRRLLRLTTEGGRERFGLALLEQIDCVEVVNPARSPGALISGGLLVTAGLLAGVFVDAFGFHLFIALVVAAALIGLGVISASKFFVADETATVVFRAGLTELGLPLHSRQAVQDAHTLMGHFFELKTGQLPAPFALSGLPGEGDKPEAHIAGSPDPDPSEGAATESSGEGDARDSADSGPFGGQSDAHAAAGGEQRQELS